MCYLVNKFVNCYQKNHGQIVNKILTIVLFVFYSILLADPIYVDREAGISLGISKKGLAVVEIYTTNATENLITYEFISGMHKLLSYLESQPDIKGVLFYSGRKNFSNGTHIRIMRDFNNFQHALEGARNLQRVFDRIEDLVIPSFVAVEGYCIGGGLELALAVDFRIGSSHKDAKLKFMFPELRLGIMPGAGGTYRLPRLIGVPHALEIIYKGRIYKAKKAKEVGLVDLLIDESGDDFKRKAIKEANRLMEKGLKPRKIAEIDTSEIDKLLAKGKGKVVEIEVSSSETLIEKEGGGKKSSLNQAQRTLLTTMRAGLAVGNKKTGELLNRDQALALERTAFAELAMTSIAQHMMIEFMKGSGYVPVMDQPLDVMLRDPCRLLNDRLLVENIEI